VPPQYWERAQLTHPLAFPTMSLATHRTRGVGELLDATFTFYRSNFPALVTVTTVLVAPPAIIKAVVPTEYGVFVDAAGNIFLPVAQGAIAALVAAAIERSEVLSVGDALRSGAGRSGSLIAAQIASGLMFVIGLLLLVVPGFIALAWTAVCVPVVMIEQLGYSKAIDRSRALARGRKGHVLGTVLLAWLLVYLVMIGGGALMGVVIGSEGSVADLMVSLLLAVLLPIPAVAMTFLYYDLRVRAEGADLDAMISALPAPAPAPLT
jgi:hypothetical protein